MKDSLSRVVSAETGYVMDKSAVSAASLRLLFIAQIALVLHHDNGKRATVYCVLGAGKNGPEHCTLEAAERPAGGGFVQCSGVAAAVCGI